jgi:hypothetical protein
MSNTFTLFRRYGLPVSMAAAGVAIFFATTQNYDWIDLTWPLFIMLGGLPLLYIALNSEQAGRVRLIFPGVIITGTGAILQYQLITEHWHSWTYAWALYSVFFGLGLWYQGQRLQVKPDVKQGRWMVAGGAGVFILLWLLMETVVFSGMYQGIIGYLLSALLFGSGLIWGLNKYRVARVMAKSQVIHGDSPEPPSQAAQVGAGTTADPADTVAQELERRKQAIKNRLPEPEAEDATAQDIISEYRPPKEIDESASSDVDPDLQAKIDAALKDEE